jgi:hypothetical protein
MTAPARRIPLDRRVLVVREDRIDLRPERGAVLWPLIGLAIGLALFALVALFANDLSTTLLAVMLLAGLIFAPLSAMGVIYSIIGAAVVVERKKQSVRFQQGVLGLGLGTYELVPFWKIEHIEVADFPLGDAPSNLPRPAFDLRAWDIVLVKASGKRLSIGQVVAANKDDLLDEGFDRALDAAEAIAALTDKPVVITAAVEDESLQEMAEPEGAEDGEPTVSASEEPPRSPLSRARERGRG